MLNYFIVLIGGAILFISEIAIYLIVIIEDGRLLSSTSEINLQAHDETVGKINASQIIVKSSAREPRISFKCDKPDILVKN